MKKIVSAATQARAQSKRMVSAEDKISSLIDLYVQEGVQSKLKETINFPISDYDLIKKRFFDELTYVATLSLNIVNNIGEINHIIENSILGALMVDLSVIDGIPYIKNYLESNGFNSVNVQRTTSPRNGRKNVWLVTATKS